MLLDDRQRSVHAAVEKRVVADEDKVA